MWYVRLQPGREVKTESNLKFSAPAPTRQLSIRGISQGYNWM